MPPVNENMPMQPGSVCRLARSLARITDRIVDITGHVAAAMLLLLTLSIVAGITLRLFSIDNSWTYDLDLYSLIWLAFLGAVYTARQGQHVSAGIALENILGGRGMILGVIRFAVIAAFLVVFTVSGWQQALNSYQTGETTLDVVQWPVWVAAAALPAGTGLWLLAEISRMLRHFAGQGRQDAYRT